MICSKCIPPWHISVILTARVIKPEILRAVSGVGHLKHTQTSSLMDSQSFMIEAKTFCPDSKTGYILLVILPIYQNMK